MNIINIISRQNYISVNKILIKELGLDEAVLLGELASEHEYWKTRNELDAEGYFFSTVENIQEATGMTDYEQRKAITSLQNAGIIETKRKGMPSRRYIKINEAPVLKIFENKISKNLRTSSQKIKEQDIKNFETNKNNIIKTNNNNIIHIGEYGNVSLTPEQMEKLKKEVPYYEEWIQKLDTYIQSTGKKYKDHLATIRNWVRREKEQKPKRANQRRYTENDRYYDNLNEYYDN